MSAAKRAIGVLLALASAAVAHAADVAPMPHANGAVPDPIARMISTAGCSDDAQCRVIGIGARACGGPESYAAWSTAATDDAALRQLVERHAQGRRKALEAAGINSTCEVMLVPGSRCERPLAGADGNGRCILVPRDGGSGGMR